MLICTSYLMITVEKGKWIVLLPYVVPNHSHLQCGGEIRWHCWLLT